MIGSQAYGLAGENSDVDRRGIYLPPADLHWSLSGVPEQLENDTEEAYWEIGKFIRLALKANPNVLECLYSPTVEYSTEFAREVLATRHLFLSKRIYQAFNAYALSQFKKLERDLRNQGEPRWKHVMHLIRLLLSGMTALRDGFVPLDVGQLREQLLSIRSGQVPWAEVDKWRVSLHAQFDEAFAKSKLPEEPDYHRANQLLLRARRLAASSDYST